MNLDDLKKEMEGEEQFDGEDDDGFREDLTDALDLLQRGLVLVGQIVIKPSTGRIRFAPEELPDYVEELEQFLNQWSDYGKKALNPEEV